MLPSIPRAPGAQASLAGTLRGVAGPGKLADVAQQVRARSLYLRGSGFETYRRLIAIPQGPCSMNGSCTALVMRRLPVRIRARALKGKMGSLRWLKRPYPGEKQGSNPCPMFLFFSIPLEHRRGYTCD